MLPVGRKPVVQYVVEELALSGIRQVIFITGPGKTSIENHFDINSELIHLLRESGKEDLLAELDFERREMEYFYTRQRRQLGLGHAILCARSMVGDRPFVVALGDSIIGLHAQSDIVGRMVEEFERSKAAAVVAFEEVPPEEVVHYGIACPRGRLGPVFELGGLVEKPSVGEAASNLAVAARYVLAPRIFSLLATQKPGKSGEIQLTDAIGRMIAEGGKVLGVVLDRGIRRYDIGNHASYFEAFIEFVLDDPDLGPALRGHCRRLLAQDGRNGGAVRADERC
jgi:UTP--glucose-1-phosphate uridylyltransferase